jgi:hypothetical protein
MYANEDWEDSEDREYECELVEAIVGWRGKERDDLLKEKAKLEGEIRRMEQFLLRM